MLISLLIFCIVAGLIYWCLTILPIPAPFKTIALVVFVVICIVWLLQMAGGLGVLTPHSLR